MSWHGKALRQLHKTWGTKKNDVRDGAQVSKWGEPQRWPYKPGSKSMFWSCLTLGWRNGWISGLFLTFTSSSAPHPWSSVISGAGLEWSGHLSRKCSLWNYNVNVAASAQIAATLRRTIVPTLFTSGVAPKAVECFPSSQNGQNGNW